MQYPIIDNLIHAYLVNSWTGLNVKNLIQIINPNINNVNVYTNEVNLIGINSGFSFTVDVPGDNYIGNLAYNDDKPTLNGIYALVEENTEYTLYNFDTSNFRKNYLCYLDNKFRRVIPFIPLDNLTHNTFTTPQNTKYITFRFGSEKLYQPGQIYTTKFMLLKGGYDPNITINDYDYTEMLYDNISNRLKLPLPHYFPHPVIDALQRAAAGTQTADDTEVLRHYLTPLGIGGI